MGVRQENDPALFFETHIFVCTNRREDGHPRGSCAEKGSEALRDYAKSRAKALKLKGVRVNAAGCLDRCEHGPCMLIYPEGVWYRADSEQAVDDILAQHVRDGRRAVAQMIPDRFVASVREPARKE
jgi:(2Fe-2S) ferredoxin